MKIYVYNIVLEREIRCNLLIPVNLSNTTVGPKRRRNEIFDVSMETIETFRMRFSRNDSRNEIDRYRSPPPPYLE